MNAEIIYVGKFVCTVGYGNRGYLGAEKREDTVLFKEQKKRESVIK